MCQPDVKLFSFKQFVFFNDFPTLDAIAYFFDVHSRFEFLSQPHIYCIYSLLANLYLNALVVMD